MGGAAGDLQLGGAWHCHPVQTALWWAAAAVRAADKRAHQAIIEAGIRPPPCVNPTTPPTTPQAQKDGDAVLHALLSKREADFLCSTRSRPLALIRSIRRVSCRRSSGGRVELRRAEWHRAEW